MPIMLMVIGKVNSGPKKKVMNKNLVLTVGQNSELNYTKLTLKQSINSPAGSSPVILDSKIFCDSKISPTFPAK